MIWQGSKNKINEGKPFDLAQIIVLVVAVWKIAKHINRDVKVIVVDVVAVVDYGTAVKALNSEDKVFVVVVVGKRPKLINCNVMLHCRRRVVVAVGVVVVVFFLLLSSQTRCLFVCFVDVVAVAASILFFSLHEL